MSRVAPRMLESQRRELNEKVQHFSSLTRLRATLEHQLQALGEGGPNEEPERTQRRQHLHESLAQIDQQLDDARAEVNGSVRVLRMLENGGPGGEPAMPRAFYGR